MVITDNWDTQEGYISQGNVIGFVTLGVAVVAGEPLAWGTATANKVVMTLYSNPADSCAVALKGGAAGDQIPAVFYGVVKMAAYSVCTVGGAVINSGTAGTTVTYGNITPLTAVETTEAGCFLVSNNGTGTAYVLGMALQDASVVGDEILVLVGGMR